MKILFIRYGHIGDVLLDTPLVREAKKVLGFPKIHYLTKSKCAEIMDENQYVEEVIKRDKYSLSGLIKKIRREKFDIIFDLQHNLETILLTFLSSAKTRVSIEKKRGNFVYNLRVNPDFSNPYTVFHRLSLLTPFGYKNFSIQLDFPVSKHLIEMMKKWLKVNGGVRNVAIHAVTGNILKDWPLINYIKIADRLSKDFNFKVFFLWSKENIGKVKEVLSLSEKRHNLAPPTRSLKKLAAFLNSVDLYFGADSGPKHIAVSQNTPTFTLFTHVEPKSWTPPSNHFHDFSYKGLPCQPCWTKYKCPLKTYDCVNKLDVEEVYSKLKIYLKKLVLNKNTQI